ncbi:MAG TPA: type II toxin-antitoxin system HicB family antitoxin [Acidobacteriaceae bacterium]|jgi:predicted RNase H-like HicB family nuclease
MIKLYPVIYEWSGKNFSGYAPDIPGCAATAKTLAGVRTSLKGALEAHLQWMFDDGDRIPHPSKKTTIDLKEDPEFPFPKGYYVVVEQVPLALPEKKRQTKTRREHTRELTAA